MSNETITIDTTIVTQTHLCTKCIVCDEPIVLSQWETMKLSQGHGIYKMCDKCKAAILHMREQMS